MSTTPAPDKQAIMAKHFGFIPPPSSPAPGAVMPPGAPAPQLPIQTPPPAPVPAPAKPQRSVGNIFTAIQAQATFNPGQPTPPDPTHVNVQATNTMNPNGTAGGIAPVHNVTKNAPPTKMIDQGTVGAMGQKKAAWGDVNR